MFRSSTTQEIKKHVPSPEEIRHRAFEIHIALGEIDECDLEEWLQSERELQEEQKRNRKRSKTN